MTNYTIELTEKEMSVLKELTSMIGQISNFIGDPNYEEGTFGLMADPNSPESVIDTQNTLRSIIRKVRTQVES